MTMTRKKPVIIGVSTCLNFTDYKALKNIPARIDTGARTSSLWVSDIRLKDDDKISFLIFGPGSEFYTGKRITLPLEGMRTVTNSTGQSQDRYMVKMNIKMNRRRLKARFTLSNREAQAYPILIGRNTLRGNFLVDSSDPGEAPLYKDPQEQNDYDESEAV